METKTKSTRHMLMEAMMRICKMESDEAYVISEFVAENQIIRPICNEPFSFAI